MLVQIYKCRRCGSVGLEDEDANRSDDYVYHCPFCDEGKDTDVCKVESNSENIAEYEIAMKRIAGEIQNLMRKSYVVHGCIQHGNNVESVEDSHADYFGVYEVQPDGTEQNIADFYGKTAWDDAQMFALEKNREESK